MRYRAAGDELTVEFAGTALADFDYARIGICVHLSDPVVVGRPATSWGARGETRFTFPHEIVAPDLHTPQVDAFHRPFSRLTVVLASGTQVDYQFEGDTFELEDQRNWTDRRSRSIPWRRRRTRHRAAAGSTFAQRLRLVCGAAQVARPHAAGDYRVRLGEEMGRLPPIGVFQGRESDRSLRPRGGFDELNARRRPSPRSPAATSSSWP